MVVASSGRILVESGGTLQLASGATLTLTGQALTSTGALSANSVTSTGTGTFNAVTSTGTGTFNAVTSTGTGTFNAVSSTGTGTFNAVSSTGTGAFNAVTSTGAITGNYHVTSAIAAASSGSTGFVSYGVTQIWSCGTDTGHVFTMPVAAAAGVEKWITCVISTSTAPAVVTIAGTLIEGNTTLTFSSGAVNTQWIHLMAQNTTNWFVLGKSTDITVS